MVVAAWLAAGCSGPVVEVKGRVTCQDKPVPGVIRFSLVGEEATSVSRTVTAEMKEDGVFRLRLTSIGKYKVVVSPRDINYPPGPGEVVFPCLRSAQEYEVKAGVNLLNMEMTPCQP